VVVLILEFIIEESTASVESLDEGITTEY